MPIPDVLIGRGCGHLGKKKKKNGVTRVCDMLYHLLLLLHVRESNWSFLLLYVHSLVQVICKDHFDSGSSDWSNLHSDVKW